MAIFGEISVATYLPAFNPPDGAIEVFRYGTNGLLHPDHEHYHLGDPPVTAAALGLAKLVALVRERAQLEDFERQGDAIVPVARELLARQLTQERGSWVIARRHEYVGDKALAYAHIRNNWPPKSGQEVRFLQLEVADPDLGQYKCRRAAAAVIDAVIIGLSDDTAIRLDGRGAYRETRSSLYLETIGLHVPRRS